MSKILIIGGGVSGLSAGIYARLCGDEAIICEKHMIAGGNLTGWDRGEYHIDNCIHWLTGTNPKTKMYKMWEELGALGNVDVYQGDTLFTSEYDGKTLSLSRDISKLEADMLAVAPEDEKEIKRFVRAVKTVQGFEGIGGENHDEKISFFDMMRYAPRLIRYYRLSTGELAKRFKSPAIRCFLTSFFTDRFMSLAVIFVFAHFCGDNGGIPKGSSCAMAERMTERFLSLGGTLLLGKEAERINLLNGRATSVSFKDGSAIAADYVVVTTDPAVTFGKLLDVKMPNYLAKQYKNEALMRFSSLQSAFACDAPSLPIKGDFAIEVPKRFRLRLRSDYLIVREFSHEKDFAPENKNILQTMTFCDENTSKKFIALRRDKRTYSSVKRHLSDVIRRIIEEKFPELKNKLKLLDVWTPATYNRYVSSEMGSYMSFAMKAKFTPTRLRNRLRGAKNVILATQWLQAPGGLPIAAKGGMLAIKEIMRKEKRGFAY